jgi:hemerythrin
MGCTIEFKDKYIISNDLIDNQHKKLFEIANEAIEYHHSDKLDAKEKKSKVKATLHSLSEYLKTHLKDEEKFMKEIDYPAYAEHKKLHTNIVKTMNDLLQTSKSFDELEKGLIYILNTVFTKHILEKDILIQKWYERNIA